MGSANTCAKSDAEGVALANDCKYGLGAGIWTLDLSRAHRVAAEIESGLCWVNTHHRNDPSSPWYVYRSANQDLDFNFMLGVG